MTDYELKNLTKIVIDLVDHSGENHLFVLAVLQHSGIITLEEQEDLQAEFNRRVKERWE